MLTPHVTGWGADTENVMRQSKEEGRSAARLRVQGIDMVSENLDGGPAVRAVRLANGGSEERCPIRGKPPGCW